MSLMSNFNDFINTIKNLKSLQSQNNSTTHPKQKEIRIYEY